MNKLEYNIRVGRIIIYSDRVGGRNYVGFTFRKSPKLIADTIRVKDGSTTSVALLTIY